MHLYYCYRRIPEVEEELMEAMFEFKQICAYILYTKDLKNEDKQVGEYCEVSMGLVPE